ncbi:MAG TPA: aminoacyl-tRNA hydrolase [Smithellaceae bacterium]|jgi:PTH1 family peptidyl-tRNA hydrolase|nr:aminoacyl-tRNA hydrolase [Syntrophaceae bacterium]NMC91486.1 aminoacyl-tRNA hydrolase [Smithella sp.]OQC72981.1 MAG: Peptidyl-tRNA hydrolase [Deltaproteobacteria bacterium ADurb.Bin002]HNV56534.1 aminoacyl-tRNA hydrolase [Smithellaceae bacterium]MBP8665541.1 aminoacyl-tRNA hydrolase [Syntrophaceae bacterium]
MRLFSFGKYLFRFQKERGQVVYLVVGLGNPGKRYEFTRHNIGFMVADLLAARWKVDLKQKSFNALWGKGTVEGKNVLLAKPQTFMNLSGTAVKQLQSFFKTEISNLIVIHDDLDLPYGAVRMKAGGGTAGHKGLASIESNLGTSGFMRVRLGIGKPVDKSRIEGYVLEPFRKEEQVMLPEVIHRAADASAEIVLNGLQKAISKYQTKNIDFLKKEE